MKLNEFEEIPHLKPGEYKEYILSDKNKNAQLLAFIEKHASYAHHVYQQTHKILYRGIKYIYSNDAAAFIGHSRENRPGYGLGEYDSLRINQAMKKEGFAAIRSNSIFCTSDASNLGVFGDPYYIYPIGAFNMTWSPYIHDFNYVVRAYKVDQKHKAIQDKLYNEWHKNDSSNWHTNETIPGELISFMYLADYRTTDLKGAVLSGSEVMINGSYLALRVSSYRPLLKEWYKL